MSPTFCSAIVDSQWQGVFAPRGTPAEIVERLHEGLSRVMRASEVVERLGANSAQPYLRASPADFATFVERENEHWAAIIKEVGAKVN